MSGRPGPSRARRAGCAGRGAPTAGCDSAAEAATRRPRPGAEESEEAAYHSAVGLDRHRPEELFVLGRQLGRDRDALLATGEEDAGVGASAEDLLDGVAGRVGGRERGFDRL